MSQSRWPGVVVWIVGAVWLVSAGSVMAQDEASSSAVSRLESRLEQLDQEVRILKRQMEIEKEAATTKGKETAVVSASKDGFTIQSADKAFQLKLRGYMQADGRAFLENEPGNSTFLLRRVRPVFDGTLWKNYEFRIMPELAGGTSSLTTVLVDAYIDANLWKEARFRFGKFKAPFSIERLQTVTDDPFIEFGLPVNLAPNRDVGVQVSGDFFDSALSYAVGAFNGSANNSSNDVDTDDDKDVVARVFAHPFKPLGPGLFQNLGVGVATSFGHQEGTPGSFRSPGQQTVFSYRSDVTADGAHVRVSPQAYYYWGPVGVLSEFIWSRQTLKRAGVAQDIGAAAWQLAVSYALTGDEVTYKGVNVKQPFDLQQGTWGAVELVGRYSGLVVDKDAFINVAQQSASIQRADAVAIGVNWHLSRNLKWMLDCERTQFNGGSANGDRDSEKVVLTRWQLSY